MKLKNNIFNKIIFGILLFEMLFSNIFILKSNADEEFRKVRFRVINTLEEYKICILYPESYINYINVTKNLSHTIDSLYNNSRARTDYISYFNLNKAKKDLYEEGGVKYLQIETSTTGNISIFEVISTFPLSSIKIRYTSDSRDVIIHLNQFASVTDKEVTVKYDYMTNDVVKENQMKFFNKYVVFIIICVMALLIASSADRQIKVRRN